VPLLIQLETLVHLQRPINAPSAINVDLPVSASASSIALPIDRLCVWFA
jgi:hypothetical protein